MSDADKAAPDKGAAARAELDEHKTIEFRGVTFKLEPQLPPTLLFDVIELEAAGFDPLPVFRFVRSVVGPDTFVEIRNSITAGTNVNELMDELITVIFEAYGLTLGESPASPDS